MQERWKEEREIGPRPRPGEKGERRAAGASSRFRFSDVKGFDAIDRGKSRDALRWMRAIKIDPHASERSWVLGYRYQSIVMVRHDSPAVCTMWQAMCEVDDGELRFETASHGSYFC